jgi:hypothetical protein
MTTEDTTYQGWKNHPTWAVNLWLSNEETLYSQAVDMATEAIEQAPDDENVQPSKYGDGRDPIWTIEETERYRLADTLKDWVTDELAPDLGASFAADLLGYALGEVDWHEIADSWLETARDHS